MKLSQKQSQIKIKLWLILEEEEKAATDGETVLEAVSDKIFSKLKDEKPEIRNSEATENVSDPISGQYTAEAITSMDSVNKAEKAPEKSSKTQVKTQGMNIVRSTDRGRDIVRSTDRGTDIVRSTDRGGDIVCSVDREVDIVRSVKRTPLWDVDIDDSDSKNYEQTQSGESDCDEQAKFSNQ